MELVCWVIIDKNRAKSSDKQINASITLRFLTMELSLRKPQSRNDEDKPS